jgi:hypothetical protein
MTQTYTTLAIAFIAGACGGRANVQCEQDPNCDLSGGGRCLMASTGNKWCAYPDPQCPSGYRYTDQDIGDGLSGICTAAGQVFTLTVNLGGDGSGTVASSPDSLLCSGATCTGTFAASTDVQLTETPSSGAFLGWSGDCTGFSTCTVTLDHDRTVGASFGTSGEGLWVDQLGGSGDERAYAMATTSDGNLIAVGQFEGIVQAGQQSLVSHGSTDIYVVKLDSGSGNVLWAKAIGGVNGEEAAGVALDAMDNIYIGGTFAGSVDFGGGTMLVGAGANDALVVKLTATGDFVWARGIGGSDYDFGDAIAVRGDTVALSARFRSSMTVNGTAYTVAGQSDVFVATYSTDGTYRWGKQIGGTGIDIGFGIAVDADGNVVSAGRFANSVDFGGGSVPSAGSFDAYFAKYSGSTGTYLLAKTIGSTGGDGANALAVDAAKNMIVVGAFAGSVDFGNGTPLVATTAEDIFVAKYSAAGSLAWAKGYGATGAGTPAQVVTSVSTSASGDVAMTGNFCGAITFGGPMLSGASACPNNDIFAVHLSGADGSHMNSVRAGGQGDEYGQGVTQTADGRFFISGRFQGFADFAAQALTSAGGNDAFMLGLAPL